jgi:streptogramin lyase
MEAKTFSRKALFSILYVLFLMGIKAHSANPVAIGGVVSSQQEGKMEGVLVSAKKEGSTITVSVVSDSQGRYAFPGDRLSPGIYHLKIRATGYDLEDPGVVKLEDRKTAQVDLKLQKSKNLAAQMTPADWFLSNPEIKKRLIDDLKFGQNCVGCHSLTPVMTSKYPEGAWQGILSRMLQYHSSSLFEPGEVRVPIRHDYQTVREDADYGALAKFISSINLSSHPDGKWSFPLKTMPRLKGRGTRVIITEFAVPRRESQPHDVAVDSDGMVWYNDHGNQYIGRLNPRTGEVKEWLSPGVEAKNAPGRASGRPRFDLRQENTAGTLWFGKITVDKKTDTLTKGKGYLRADGMIWEVKGSPQADGDPEIHEVVRTNPKTGETKVFKGPDRQMRFYGDEVDSQGNFYGASLQYGVVGILNGKNGEWAFVPTPTPDSGPRRTALDKQDRFWYAEYYAGAIGMFDPKKWEAKEWMLHPNSLPYGIGVDKNGEAWAAGQGDDNLYRLNPTTGQVTTYPKGALMYGQSRHLFVDNSTTPVTIWIGQDHMAAITRIEPLN